MSFDSETWIKAWGWNAPLIAGGINDEFPRLPKVAANQEWLLIRGVTQGKDEAFPTWNLALLDHGDGDPMSFQVLTRRKIDHKFYGPAGVLEAARLIREDHCA